MVGDLMTPVVPESANLEVAASYNPLERRDACKVSKETNKKSATMQPSTKNAASYPKNTPHNGRRSDATNVNTANQPTKATTSSGRPPVYPEAERAAFEQQIMELKLSADSLEKERDFYFAKLRDIEILCQYPEIENLLVVRAIKRILYAADDVSSVVVEAQAMIVENQQQLAEAQAMIMARDACCPLMGDGLESEMKLG